MTETEIYDVIIIGGGHNGLTLGSYLARSGLEVLVLEKRHEEGGGLCTEELTLSGFLHNVHANYHTFVDLAPPVRDLDVRGHGVEYVRPEVQMASIYEDGTALTIHSDLEKTCASIARFSEADAETFRRLYTEAHGFIDLLLGTLMYQPPLNVKELTKALAAFGVEDRSEFLSVKLRRETINQFLNRHFENDKVKAHLAFHGAICGYTNDVAGLAIGYPLLAGKIDNWHLCIGGSHRLAHALWRDLAQHGGVLLVDADVTKILVENGRAVGVRMADGREYAARQAVASTVAVEQTFLEFLDAETVGEEFSHKVKTAVKHKDWTLFSVHAAMTKLPEYEAAEFDPDVNRAWVVNLGYGSLEELNADWKMIREGELPPPKPNAAVNSLYDPTDAPEGYYTGLLRQFAPFVIARGGEGQWESMGRWYGERCLEEWRKYAPNLTEDAFLEWVPYTPLQIAQKIPNMVQGDWMMGEISLDNMLDQRPLPELGQYRTPVDRLYMAGSTQHPHGYITFGPGYNALQVMADDLGIKPWWRKV